ncbi:MAG: PAS domain-containing sensor histidine kinase [Bacteroidota bacterium]
MYNSASSEDLLLRLDAIIETALDGIITIDPGGIIESINTAGAKLFEYAAEELIGENINILMPEPDHSAHDSYLNNYLETGKAKIIGIGREVKGKKKDGTIFPLRLAVSEVQLSGEYKIFTGILHDLTAEKVAEEKMKKYSEELEREVQRRTQELADANLQLEESLKKEMHLNELKSRFVSLASHEFRTPLSTIMSSATLVDRYEEANYLEKRKKHTARIKASVRDLTGILNDFLSLEKLERGKVVPKPSSFILVEVLVEIIEEMQDVAKKGQKLRFQNECADRGTLHDKSLFKNILNNLISNAIKYSPEDTQIHIFCRGAEAGFSIWVKDEGMGIPQEEQAHLFERFFRAHNVENIKGTGLGLSIVKEYVDLMGGRISFQSKENQGTTFHLELPWKAIKKE